MKRFAAEPRTDHKSPPAGVIGLRAGFAFPGFRFSRLISVQVLPGRFTSRSACNLLTALFLYSLSGSDGPL